MKADDVALAVLRDWPGMDERLIRLARAQKCFDKDGVPAPELLKPHVVADYFHKWASSILSEVPALLSDAELELRYAISERQLIEVEDDATGRIVTLAQERARSELAAAEAEIAKRATVGRKQRPHR